MSVHFKSHGYLEFRCCIIAKQCAIMRLENILKICLVFFKLESGYVFINVMLINKKHVEVLENYHNPVILHGPQMPQQKRC